MTSEAKLLFYSQQIWLEYRKVNLIHYRINQKKKKKGFY